MPIGPARSVRLAAVLLSALLALAACEKEPTPPESADSAARTPADRQTLTTNEPEPTPALDLDDADFHRFGQREAPAKPAGLIRLATYNIENLFDDIDDPALSDRNEDIDDAKPAAEMVAVAEAIRAIDADILALQEIESLEALTAFRDEYLSDMGYEHIISPDAGDERGIEQAVLSRFPIVETRQWVRAPLGGVHPAAYGDQENWYAGEPIVFHRSPLLVTVEVPADVTDADEPYRLTLIAVHQKSGRYSDYWRDREAAGTMEIVETLRHAEPGRNLIILGDFNATTADASVETYLVGGFTDLFEGRTGDEITSHASGRRIDLILVGPAALPEVRRESAFVLGTTAGPEGLGWEEAALLPGYAADHYPVVVDIEPREKASGG